MHCEPITVYFPIAGIGRAWVSAPAGEVFTNGLLFASTFANAIAGNREAFERNLKMFPQSPAQRSPEDAQ